MQVLIGLLLAFIPIVAISFAGQAAAQCNPRDFVVREISSFQVSAETELAFALSATREEFDSAKKSGAMSGSYGIISGSANFDEAKERALRIAQAINFETSSSYASNYFSQTTSRIWADNYVRCLGTNSPGLHVWFAQRDGNYFTFRAFWVGTDTAVGSATYDGETVVDGGVLVSQPARWNKAQTYNIVVRRDENRDIFLQLSVGGQIGSAVVVKDPPDWEWVNEQVVTDVISAASHGPNPGCSAGSASTCVLPTRPGAFLRSGTGNMIEFVTSDPTTYSQRITADTPQQICITITQSTGCCECPQRASGKLSAIQEYPRAK